MNLYLKYCLAGDSLSGGQRLPATLVAALVAAAETPVAIFVTIVVAL